MEQTVKQQILESLRSVGHAIMDAEDHLKSEDIDRACNRLSEAKNVLGRAMQIADMIPN